MSKYVVVGGSAAGIGAVEAIREVDPVGTITVISEEPFPQYSRPMIADFLSGEATSEKMKYRDDNFWEKNEVQALTGRKALRLSLTDKYVELDRGDRISFDKLLIATGGKPILPKIEGTDKDGVFTFTSSADANHIAARIEKAKKVVVIGGGLIGVSVAEALVRHGTEVTIVELKNRILSLILDAVASEIVEDVIRKAGVNIVTGQTVQRIRGKIKDKESVVDGVVLTSGEEIPCDLVVIAIGVVPRTELVTGTDVKTNRGIIVDKSMRTTVPDIYACGDVAEVYDFVLDAYGLLPLWPVAHLGGRVAGYNMAGKKVDYSNATSMSSSNYFDLPIISLGTVNPKEDNTYEILVHHDPARNLYRKIVLRDNMIVGMILVNEIERAGTIFHLMKNRANVKKFKQHLISENFSLAAIPSPLRRKLFIGV